MTSCLDLYMCCWWSIFCALLSRARRRVLQGPISGFPFCRGLCFHRSELDGAVLVPLFSRALYKREADEWMFVGRRPPRTARGDNILFTALAAAATGDDSGGDGGGGGDGECGGSGDGQRWHDGAARGSSDFDSARRQPRSRQRSRRRRLQ